MVSRAAADRAEGGHDAPEGESEHDASVAVIERHAPMYHVVLWDDNDHTYDYVIEMLGHVFGYDVAKAYGLAVEVDTTGRCVLATLPLERAEVKRDQVLAYGADWRMPRSAGSMSCTVELAP